MSRIGIISGGGILPILIGNSYKKSNHEVIYFCIDPYAKKSNYITPT